MTCYNREKYIAYAIESVLASTYTNFELIIVDDGSTDNSLTIARNYEKPNPQIKVYLNEKKLGDYPNRNMAASYAKGKYLKYVDADDYIYSHGLAQMVYYMEQPALDGIAMGIFGITQDNQQPYPLRLEPADTIKRHFVQNIFTLGIAPLSTIIRRDIFEAENGFKNLRMVGDFECWTRISLKYAIAILPIVGCWYRKHDAQELNDYNKFLGDYFKISKDVVVTANQKKYITETEFKTLSRTVDKNFIKQLGRNFIKNRNSMEFKQNISRYGQSMSNLIKSII